MKYLMLSYLLIQLAACGGNCGGAVAPPGGGMRFKGTLTCDFSKVNSLENVRPATDAVDGLYVYQGDFALELQLPGGQNYKGNAYLVTLRTEDTGSLVRDLHIVTASDSLDATIKLAERLIAEWGLEKKDLDKWNDAVKADPAHAYTFETMRNDITPTLSIKFKRTLEKGKPWCLFLDVFWKRAS